MGWWSRAKPDIRKENSPGGLYDAGQPRRYSRKPKRVAEEDGSSRASRHSLDLASEAGSGSGAGSRSPSPTSRSYERRPRHGQPLPLPCAPPMKNRIERTFSGTHLSPTQGAMPHHPGQPTTRPAEIAGEVDYASGSVSSVSSLGSVDVVDPWQPPRNSNLRPSQDVETLEQPRSSGSQMGQAVSTPRHSRKNSRQELSRPCSPLPGVQPASSPRRARPPLLLGEGMVPPPLQIPPPESSLSSPARSPRSFWAAQRGLEPGFPSSGQSSSPRSGATSAYNSTHGDPALWPQQQMEEKSSPIPSPRRRSPAPSRGTSTTVSPLHPRAAGGGGPGLEATPSWHEEGRGGHPLPLPPRSSSSSSPFPTSPVPSGQSPTTALPRITTRIDLSCCATAPKWSKGKLIGSGSFGNVYVGFNNDSGAFCAMKEVLLVSDDSKSKESVKQLGQEISLLSKLRHPNIVQYIGTDSLEDRLYIYLEYVSGGSIHKLLQEYGAFREPVIRSYTRQILSGLAYLHSMNTIHRDIKGANILVDPKGRVKLADFGMAKHITAHSFPLSFKGSPYWMAPEVFKHTNGYDLAVDIWSLGCTVLEMATTKPPWHQYEGVAAMFKIGNSKEIPSIPLTLSREGQDFVRRCLQRRPEDRPTAGQLLEHPFVRDAPQVFIPDDQISGADLLPSATNGIRSLNVTQTASHRPNSSHDVEGAYSSQGRARVLHSPSSELSPRGHGPMGASPALSPHVQPRPVHQVYSGMSTPMMSSGCSTPQGGGYGSSPMLANGVYGALSSFPSEGYGGNIARTQSGSYGSPALLNGGGNMESRKEFQWSTPTQRTPDGSPRRRDWTHVDNNSILDLALRRMPVDDSQTQHHGNGTLVDHVSQQFLRPVSHRQSTPVLSRTNSHELGP